MKYLVLILTATFLFVTTFGQQVKSGRSKHDSNREYLTVKLRVSDMSQSDTLQMSLYTLVQHLPELVTATLNHDGLFVFKIPVKATYGYFFIDKKIPQVGVGLDMISLTDRRYYWTAGDNILMDFNRFKKSAKEKSSFYKVFISGIGAAKYNLAIKADSIKHESSIQILLLKNFNQMDGANRIDSAFKFLDVTDSKVSKTDKEVLKADILFNGSQNNFSKVTLSFKDSLVKKIGLNRSYLLKRFQKFEEEYINRVSFEGLIRSFYFPSYAFNETVAEYLISHPDKIVYSGYWAKNVAVDDILPIINEKYSGVVHDIIVANLLFSGITMLNAQKTTASALASLTNQKIKLQLESLINSHREGTPAYNFNLPDTARNYYSLRSLKGKVVFQDFYFYGCGACSALYKNVLKSVEDHYSNNSDVVFVSIGSDANLNRVKEGIKSGSYNSPLSLNLYTEGKGFEHEMNKYYHINGYPEVLLIDKAGRIAKYNTEDIKTTAGLIKQIDRLLKE